MPIELNNNIYKLVFLDTNALSEISKDVNNSKHNFINHFDPSNWIPCFSIYNIFELSSSKKNGNRVLFDKFVDLFSIYPCMMSFPYKIIVQTEANSKDISEIFYSNYLINDGQLANTFESFINLFEGNLELSKIIDAEESEIEKVIIAWEKQRPQNGVGSKIYYSKKMEEQNVLKTLSDPFFELNMNIRLTDYRKFPGLRTMLFIQFMRVHFTNKKILKSDINDIMISCIAPYVDAIVTEKHQGDLYKQAKGRIKELNELSIYSVADLRLSKI